jgi:hypothetical protein
MINRDYTKMNVRHGYARGGKITETYTCWTCMKQRCLNPKNRSYAIYGGRGIKMCQRWIGNTPTEGFLNFLADMGERPRGMTLERINNNGDYEPSNCKWASRLEQSNNRRNVKFVTRDGLTLNLWDWGVRLFGSPKLIYGRLKLGWTLEDAMTRPVRVARSKKCHA